MSECHLRPVLRKECLWPGPIDRRLRAEPELPIRISKARDVDSEQCFLRERDTVVRAPVQALIKELVRRILIHHAVELSMALSVDLQRERKRVRGRKGLLRSW